MTVRRHEYFGDINPLIKNVARETDERDSEKGIGRVRPISYFRLNLTPSTMRYNCEVTIEKHIEVVVKEFNDPEAIYEWMEGLESFELLEGEAGKRGAKSKMTFKTKNRTFSMIETIWENDLPEKYSATYTAGGVTNNMDVTFQKVDDHRTRYYTEQEFIFKPFGMKLMGWLMPGAFKKQTMKFLNAFKKYVEEISEKS